MTQPPNTAKIRKEHERCDHRAGRCFGAEDVHILADECDRLTEQVFSYELTLDTLSKQIGEIGPALKALFEIRKIHQRSRLFDESGNFCSTCKTEWPCSTAKILGGK